MAVFRVERNKGYTVMSNHHLRNKELSLYKRLTYPKKKNQIRIYQVPIPFLSIP